MKLLLFCLVVCFCAASSSFAAVADDEQFRFGVQTALNRYAVDDPAGPTSGGSAMSFSGVAAAGIGRAGRVLLLFNMDKYSLAASQTNIGQSVSSMGGELSYQQMFRVTRAWKPWAGVGLGYTSTAYRNRYKLSPGGFGLLLADREASEISWLLNANTEWQLNSDWDMGLSAQYSSSLKSKSNLFRVGLYIVY